MTPTPVRVPFVDLRAQHARIAPDVQHAIQDVLDRCDFVLGAAVERFETAFAAYVGARHAVGVANGGDAIELALRAHDVGPGDEVITAANTFIATILAIVATGAKPVLVDIDPESYTIDPGAIGAAVTSRTRAIVPVHLYGQPADLDAIRTVADRHHLLVIEDAAQAHGAAYRGRRVGVVGDAGAFSFYPSKNLGADGDGGLVVTNDDRVADRLRQLRNYGQREKYLHAIPGRNSRLDTLQAAVLEVKLRHLDRWNSERRAHAAALTRGLADLVRTPAVAADRDHVFHLYVIETGDRDRLQRGLSDRGIQTGIHYPIPVHLQDACASLGYRAGDFPKTESAAGRVLSLPMFPELTADQIDEVVATIARLRRA